MEAVIHAMERGLQGFSTPWKAVSALLPRHGKGFAKKFHGMETAFVPVVLAAALSGCTLVPRPEAAAEEVFRNARGEAVVVPWEWAGGSGDLGNLGDPGDLEGGAW